MAAEPAPLNHEPDHDRTGGARRGPADAYTETARDSRFRLLRRRHLRATITVAVVFFTWYLAYVALSAFARDLMAHSVTGAVNAALVLGLLQFASTFLLAGLYALYARRALDPLAKEIRGETDDPPDDHRASDEPVLTDGRDAAEDFQQGRSGAAASVGDTQGEGMDTHRPGLARTQRNGPSGRRDPVAGLRRDENSGAWTDELPVARPDAETATGNRADLGPAPRRTVPRPRRTDEVTPRRAYGSAGLASGDAGDMRPHRNAAPRYLGRTDRGTVR
ncbi:MAG TPA: DUF485 domain-containing protein [Thermomonospora sp.]|nr:DUF485 domain-containing protein [Thermomonospora sp.]